MKNLILAITSITLAFGLSACGGTTIEAAQGTPGGSNRPSDSSGALSLSSSAGEFGSVTLLSTVQLSINGGKAPFTLELISGDGAINTSTNVFTAGSSESTVNVRVTDANGDVADHYFYVVTGDNTTSNGTCVAAAEAVVTQHSTGLEVLVDSRTFNRPDQIITGVGLRAYSNTMYGMYIKTEKLNTNGTVVETPAYALTNGNLGGTAKGELYVEAPAGYYVYGVGAASDALGDDIDAVKIYVAKVNAQALDFDTKECLITVSGGVQCDTTVAVPSNMTGRYFEFVGRSNKPLVTLGSAINGGKVDRMAAASTALSFTSCD